MAVDLIHGTSESQFLSTLQQIQGDLNFWLDGHHSFGGTFLGGSTTPITFELECIKRELNRLGSVVVIVDDFRCFGDSELEITDYPNKNDLVEWAKSLNLAWHVEHDMFIAKTK